MIAPCIRNAEYLCPILRKYVDGAYLKAEAQISLQMCSV